jgi:hypothetical protein
MTSWREGGGRRVGGGWGVDRKDAGGNSGRGICADLGQERQTKALHTCMHQRPQTPLVWKIKR